MNTPVFVFGDCLPPSWTRASESPSADMSQNAPLSVP